MNALFLPLFLPPLALVALVFLRSPVTPKGIGRLRQLITTLAAVQAAAAAWIALAYATGRFGVLEFSAGEQLGLAVDPSSPLNLVSVYLDGVSTLMLALVSFVGWVICRYSVRYLDGESGQGRYFQWTGFTVSAVSLMVVSGNLLMLFVAWVMTSLGLHYLLLHYGDRPAAKRAAWTKFAVSRIGDVALLGAIVAAYSEFGTLQFAELFAAVESGVEITPTATAIAALIVLAAIMKSAQFPFHTWLPQTMETPTPVSALMHAGIVNAGGYLIIRTSPLVSLAPWVLTSLAIVGAFTSCYAAVVMLTQTSVKKSLAYSTVAQMGFMMLQCGLGAFSAAMLHILAHSLYKAHAFLSSGSVMSERTSTLGVKTPSQSVAMTKTLTAALLVFALMSIAFRLFAINPLDKPGGILLGGILYLALVQWIAGVLQTGRHQLVARSLTMAGLLTLAYAASFTAVDMIVASSLPAPSVWQGQWILVAMVGACFVSMYLLQQLLLRRDRPAWLSAAYVHASNGFYVDTVLRRVFAPLMTH